MFHTRTAVTAAVVAVAATACLGGPPPVAAPPVNPPDPPPPSTTTSTATSTTTSTSTTTTTTTPPEDAAAERHHDIAYGTHPRHRLDLFVPEGDGPHPVVVWAHGGFWVQGTKLGIPSRFERMLLEAGYAVVSTNYRLAGAPPLFAPPMQYPFNPSPSQVHDFKSASRWVQDHADEYDLDADNVFASGDSAGGHVALLAAMSLGDADVTDVDLTIGEDEPSYAGAVTFAAPTNLAMAMGSSGPIGEVGVRSLMGCTLFGPCYPSSADPRTYVKGPDEVPVALVQAESDPLVPTGQGTSFVAAAEAAGFDDYTVRVEPDTVHEDVNSQVDEEFLLGWLQEHLAS